MLFDIRLEKDDDLQLSNSSPRLTTTVYSRLTFPQAHVLAHK